ncbi:hypothetical protein QBC33DRAFT_47041 [Phialemonium atrogriseum]|uniref:Uncharacterized protein n=1 Tax=Phialemonium atrogriseum TaxID=1093897 RepID=A0AAJ0C3R6_9PEZI|nr:uncharacterized protein QBC33DRAFT_47041 [Phialemonium atrogriseum]KAK1768184.1 hypothetical protein QBC33DRAFT_47041 [Phialemonium atrogriseum]
MATTTPTTMLTTMLTTTVLPESCTFEPTQTIWLTEGCDITCATDNWCIADAAVTLPCGCRSVKVQPATTTICPTSAGCIQCTTGWGIVTITESCPTATEPAS